MSQSIVEKIQGILGVRVDGIWGPDSQDALQSEVKATGDKGNPTLMKIQNLVGTKPDGFWGIKSQEALNNEFENDEGGKGGAGFTATASSFADPADVTAFNKCKAQGKSDQTCFAVGDNGVGQFGKITAQTHTPMVALHKTDMIAKWGSVNGAAHRMVRVSFNGKSIDAAVEDRLGVAGRIDLNPAAAAALGLKPPFLQKGVRWSWI
jgi:hypothetical protein